MKKSTIEPTTATLLTPPGMGAVAVVRVYGPAARPVVASMFRPVSDKGDPLGPTNRLRYGQLCDGDEPIDDVIVALLPPDGDRADVVDVSAHGGVRIATRILLALERAGATVRSADDSGTDVRWWSAQNRTETEVDCALIHARTRRAVRFLARQRIVLPATLRQLADLAEKDPRSARRQLAKLLDRWTAHRHLTHGAEVAIVGPPNAGKSTLANRLVGEEKTLTSDHAGTTRDWTAHETAMHGVPITIVDTAGVRQATDPLDAIGVRRGIERSAGADLHILVLDRSVALPGRIVPDVQSAVRSDRLIVAVNKTDLSPAWQPKSVGALGRFHAVAISARTGDGIEELRRTVIVALGLDTEDDNPPCPVSEAQAGAISSLLATAEPDSGELADGIRRLLD